MRCARRITFSTPFTSLTRYAFCFRLPLLYFQFCWFLRVCLRTTQRTLLTACLRLNLACTITHRPHHCRTVHWYTPLPDAPVSTAVFNTRLDFHAGYQVCACAVSYSGSFTSSNELFSDPFHARFGLRMTPQYARMHHRFLNTSRYATFAVLVRFCGWDFALEHLRTPKAHCSYWLAGTLRRTCALLRGCTCRATVGFRRFSRSCCPCRTLDYLRSPGRSCRFTKHTCWNTATAPQHLACGHTERVLLRCGSVRPLRITPPFCRSCSRSNSYTHRFGTPNSITGGFPPHACTTTNRAIAKRAYLLCARCRTRIL